MDGAIIALFPFVILDRERERRLVDVAAFDAFMEVLGVLLRTNRE